MTITSCRLYLTLVIVKELMVIVMQTKDMWCQINVDYGCLSRFHSPLSAYEEMFVMMGICRHIIGNRLCYLPSFEESNHEQNLTVINV